MMQPTQKFLADDGEYNDAVCKDTSMRESQEEWNPFGEEAQVDNECYEEALEDDLDCTWKDEQKNKVDAILSRRRRGEEMKDASTASGSSMDTSSAMGAMGASSSSRRRAERRHGTNTGSGSTLGLKRVDSSEEERRLRRERRRAKRSSSPTRNRSRSSSGGGSPRPTGTRPARMASSNRSGSSGNLGSNRSGSVRNLLNPNRSGSSRNLNLKGSKARNATGSEPLRRTKSQNRSLGLDGSETHDTKRGALGRTKSSARSRSTRNLRGGLSASVNSRCTNTSPKQTSGNESGMPRTSSSPLLHHKIKPEAARFRLNDPSEIIAVRTTQSRRVKRSQSPKKATGLSASTTSRPTSRKASCVTLLRSSSTSRLPLGIPTSKQENNVGPLFAQ